MYSFSMIYNDTGNANNGTKTYIVKTSCQFYNFKVLFTSYI